MKLISTMALWRFYIINSFNNIIIILYSNVMMNIPTYIFHKLQTVYGAAKPYMIYLKQ